MPYKSEAQRKYFNANRKKLEAEGVDVDHWNETSKGKDMPEKKAYGVSDDNYEQDRHLSAMPGASREEMLAATKALMARAKTLEGNLKFTGSRYAELPEDYYDSTEALKKIKSLEGEAGEESPLFYQITRDDNSPLNWDAVEKQGRTMNQKPINNSVIQNIALCAAGSNKEASSEKQANAFLTKFGPKALSIARKLGKGAFNTADYGGQAAGAAAGSMGDVLMDPEQRKALAKGDFGSTNLWDNEATGLENTENLWRRGFTGLATGSVTRPRYLTKSYAHGRNALNKALADGAKVPNKMDLGYYLSGMAKETVPKLTALGIGYSPGMVADLAATPAAIRAGSESAAATAKSVEERAEEVGKNVEDIAITAKQLVSGDKKNPKTPSLQSIIGKVEGVIGAEDPETGKPTGNSIAGVLGGAENLMKETENVVNNKENPKGSLSGALNSFSATGEAIQELAKKDPDSPTSRAISSVGDLAGTVNTGLQAVQSGFGSFKDWAVKNQKALGLGALGAAGVYGLYNILKGRSEDEEEEENKRRNYVFRMPKRAEDFGKLAAGRCWDGYEPVPGKKAYSDGSCQPAGGKKKKKKSEKKSSDIATLAELAVMQKQAKNTALDSSLKVSPHTALFGGALGAGVGGIHGLLKDPGYNEETGEKKSRLMAALKGLGLGGAIGAGAGAILPPASVLTTQSYGKLLMPLHERIAKLQGAAEEKAKTIPELEQHLG